MGSSPLGHVSIKLAMHMDFKILKFPTGYNEVIITSNMLHGSYITLKIQI